MMHESGPGNPIITAFKHSSHRGTYSELTTYQKMCVDHDIYFQKIMNKIINGPTIFTDANLQDEVCSAVPWYTAEFQ